MAPTASSTVDDRLFGVGSRHGAEPARLELVTRTCAQAWEAVRLRLAEGLEQADPAAAKELSEVLRDLVVDGPRSDGWHRRVGDIELWYGPAPIRRPREVTTGEVALLASLGVGRLDVGLVEGGPNNG